MTGRRARRSRAVHRASLAVVLAAVVLAACGPAGPTPAATSAPSPVDPVAVCALIPDPAAALGRPPIASPSGYTVGEISRCLWVYQADPVRNVGLSLGPRTTHDATLEAFGDGEVVDGLGDDARWFAANATLSVAVGERGFQLDLELDPEDATAAVAIELARSVLANLD